MTRQRTPGDGPKRVPLAPSKTPSIDPELVREALGAEPVSAPERGKCPSCLELAECAATNLKCTCVPPLDIEGWTPEERDAYYSKLPGDDRLVAGLPPCDCTCHSVHRMGMCTLCCKTQPHTGAPKQEGELCPDCRRLKAEDTGARTAGCKRGLRDDRGEPYRSLCFELTVDRLRAELAERDQRIAELDGRRREGRQLLRRMVKYVTEDRAETPGNTRLARLTKQVADYLDRTHDPKDVLR